MADPLPPRLPPHHGDTTSARPPVYRYIGTGREAVIAFAAEATAHGYNVVYAASDIPRAFGAPTTMALTTIASRFLADGHALALPSNPLDLLPRVDRFNG